MRICLELWTKRSTATEPHLNVIPEKKMVDLKATKVDTLQLEEMKMLEKNW